MSKLPIFRSKDVYASHFSLLQYDLYLPQNSSLVKTLIRNVHLGTIGVPLLRKTPWSSTLSLTSCDTYENGE